MLEGLGGRGPRRANEVELRALVPLVLKHVLAELLDKDVPAYVTRRSIQAFISNATGIDASIKSIARLCAAWGLNYGRLVRPPHATREKRILARATCSCASSAAR